MHHKTKTREKTTTNVTTALRQERMILCCIRFTYLSKGYTILVL